VNTVNVFSHFSECHCANVNTATIKRTFHELNRDLQTLLLLREIWRWRTRNFTLQYGDSETDRQQ